MAHIMALQMEHMCECNLGVDEISLKIQFASVHENETSIISNSCINPFVCVSAYNFVTWRYWSELQKVVWT